MKDNKAFVGESDFDQPPPYEARNEQTGMVNITVAVPAEQSNNHGQIQQPQLSNLDVHLRIQPQLQRWQVLIALVWLLMMLAAGIFIYVFCFLDFKNRHFPPDNDVPGSGFHFGVKAS